MTPICGKPSRVHNAGPCPLRDRHEGPCLWWLSWEDGTGAWRVIAYEGPPEARTRVLRARFLDSRPTLRDVARIAPARPRSTVRLGRPPIALPPPPPEAPKQLQLALAGSL